MQTVLFGEEAAVSAAAVWLVGAIESGGAVRRHWQRWSDRCPTLSTGTSACEVCSAITGHSPAYQSHAADAHDAIRGPVPFQSCCYSLVSQHWNF